MIQTISKFAVAVVVFAAQVACMTGGNAPRNIPTDETGLLDPGPLRSDDPSPSSPDAGARAGEEPAPSPPAGCVPEEERRDGQDNDCDGEVDEGLAAPPETRCDAQTPVLTASPALHAVRESAGLVVARGVGDSAGDGALRVLYWHLVLGSDAIVAARSGNALEVGQGCEASHPIAPLEREACGAETQQVWRLAKGRYVLRVLGTRAEQVRFTLQVLPSPQGAPVRRLAWSSLAGAGVWLGDAIVSSDPIEATHPACGTGRRWVQTMISGCTPPRAVEITPAANTRLFVGMDHANGTTVCSALRTTHEIAPTALFASLYVTAPDGAVGSVTYNVRALP